MDVFDRATDKDRFVHQWLLVPSSSLRVKTTQNHDELSRSHPDRTTLRRGWTGDDDWDG